MHNNYSALFDFGVYSREIIDAFPELAKPVTLFSSRTLSAPSLSHSTIITSVQFYSFIPVVTALTLFQGHRGVGMVILQLEFSQ